MTQELSNRLDKLLANLSAEPVADALEPTADRLARQFVGASAPLAPTALLAFCRAYIAQVPEQVANLQSTAKGLNLATLVESYTELATRYLESACTELENSDARADMEAFLILLQGAYVFSRMQEELDDRVQSFIGVPLSHLDLMDANLIVHEIIGDNFANRLDKVVTTLVQQSKVSKSLIEADLDRLQLQQAKSAGSSLSGQKVKSFAADHGLSMLSSMS